MAAIRASEMGRKVVLIEKNRRPGVKILMSGGTRCNLTNARGLRNLRVVSGPIDPAYPPNLARRRGRSIQDAFGPNGKFLRALPEGPERPSRRSNSLKGKGGVATKVEGKRQGLPPPPTVLHRRPRRPAPPARSLGGDLAYERPGGGRVDRGGLRGHPAPSTDPRTQGRGGRRRPVVSGVGDDRRRLRDRPLLRPYDRRAEARAGAAEGRGRLGADPQGADHPRPDRLHPPARGAALDRASRGDAFRPFRADRTGDPGCQPRGGPA